MDDHALLEALGLKYADEPLSDSVVLRLPASVVKRIDKIEALARGNGHRVSRSAILRSYILAGIEGTESELISSPSAGIARSDQ